MYSYEIKPCLKDILKRLFKRNRVLYEQVLKKIEEVANSDNIEHYKNLKYNMKDYKRVHVGHFVLVFSFDKTKQIISFDDFDHHDKIYQK